MSKINWNKYERQIKRQSPKIEKAMEKLARVYSQNVMVDNGDDFVVSFGVSGKGKNTLWVSFEIWDSGDADDGIYGEHGNITFKMVEDGGVIVSDFTPYNYSDNVWVDYEDDKEWDERVECMIQSLPEVKAIIDSWMEDKTNE
jgi:hypothetical protein